jgi:hypothetical protein
VPYELYLGLLTPPAAIVAFLVGYAFGSIPFGLLFTRLAGTGDIRTLGSGNIGATNVLRTGRKGLAAATLIGDMLKGAAASLVMDRLDGTDAALVAGLGCGCGVRSTAAALLRQRQIGAAVSGPDRAGLHHAPRQHCPLAGRHRTQDRRHRHRLDGAEFGRASFGCHWRHIRGMLIGVRGIVWQRKHSRPAFA